MRAKLKCICRGNWRSIVHGAEPLIGKIFLDGNRRKFVFLGVLLTDDDYCYLMSGRSGIQLLSCVGSIEGHGFKLSRDQRPLAARTRQEKLLRAIFDD
jgi:hypothetical protein